MGVIEPRRRDDLRLPDVTAEVLKRRDRLVDVGLVAHETDVIGIGLLTGHSLAPPPDNSSPLQAAPLLLAPRPMQSTWLAQSSSCGGRPGRSDTPELRGRGRTPRPGERLQRAAGRSSRHRARMLTTGRTNDSSDRADHGSGPSPTYPHYPVACTRRGSCGRVSPRRPQRRLDGGPAAAPARTSSARSDT